MDLGNLNRRIEYVGIACANIFIKTSHPAFDMNFSFHPITHVVIFSSKSLKMSTLDFLVAIEGQGTYHCPSLFLPPTYVELSSLHLAWYFC